jgi:hypothetical protein
MIQANELRIGNLVLFKGEVDVIIEIGQAGNGFCENNGYFNFDTGTIAPIPLTPEWLERCGFEYLSFDFGIANFFKLNDRFELIVVREGVKCEYERGSYYYEDEHCSIKYLHQLQNLYFALTGEELKIEL